MTRTFSFLGLIAFVAIALISGNEPASSQKAVESKTPSKEVLRLAKAQKLTPQELLAVAKRLNSTKPLPYRFATAKGASFLEALKNIDLKRSPRADALVERRDPGRFEQLGRDFRTDGLGGLYGQRRLSPNPKTRASFSFGILPTGDRIAGYDVNGDGGIDLLINGLELPSNILELSVLANPLGIDFLPCVIQDGGDSVVLTKSKIGISGGGKLPPSGKDPCSPIEGGSSSGGGGGSNAGFGLGSAFFDTPSCSATSFQQLTAGSWKNNSNIKDDVLTLTKVRDRMVEARTRALEAEARAFNEGSQAEYQQFAAADLQYQEAIAAVNQAIRSAERALNEAADLPTREALHQETQEWLDTAAHYYARGRVAEREGNRLDQGAENRPSESGSSNESSPSGQPAVGPEGTSPLGEDPRCQGRRTAVAQGLLFRDGAFCGGDDMLGCLVRSQDSLIDFTGGRCREVEGQAGGTTFQCQGNSEDQQSNVGGHSNPDRPGPWGGGPAEGSTPQVSQGSVGYSYVSTTPIGNVIIDVWCKAGQGGPCGGVVGNP